MGKPMRSSRRGRRWISRDDVQSQLDCHRAGDVPHWLHGRRAGLAAGPRHEGVGLPARPASNLAWSPDGTRVAFDGSDGASESVYVMRRRLAPRLLASGANGSGPGCRLVTRTGRRSPTSTRHGRPTASSSPRSDGAATARHRGGSSTLTAVCRVGAASWSADGTEVAFAYAGNSGTPTGERTGGHLPAARRRQPSPAVRRRSIGAGGATAISMMARPSSMSAYTEPRAQGHSRTLGASSVRLTRVLPSDELEAVPGAAADVASDNCSILSGASGHPSAPARAR